MTKKKSTSLKILMNISFQNYIELSKPHIKANNDSLKRHSDLLRKFSVSNSNSTSENKNQDKHVNYAVVIKSNQTASTSGLSNQSYSLTMGQQHDMEPNETEKTINYSDVHFTTEENVTLINH